MRKLKNEELNRLNIESFKEVEKVPLIVVLDNIRSLNNIGSVFRTCDAFLVEAVYLCGITACPPHKDIQKTALGATESVHWEYYQTTKEAIEKLKANAYQVFAIEQADQSLMLDEFEAKPHAKIAVIFGNEVSGVEDEAISLSDGVIEIPQFGTKHSLNIAVSAGIVIWDITQKIRLDSHAN